MLTVLLSGFLAASSLAGAKDGKLTGVISGAHCGVNGMACPASHDLRKSELAGIFTKDKKFFAITNVPQTFLAQWPTREATVEGTVHENGNFVDARTITVKDGNDWRVVYEDGYIVDPMGHKSPLVSAVEMNGTWVCGACASMHKGDMK